MVRFLGDMLIFFGDIGRTFALESWLLDTCLFSKAVYFGFVVGLCIFSSPSEDAWFCVWGWLCVDGQVLRAFHMVGDLCFLEVALRIGLTQATLRRAYTDSGKGPKSVGGKRPPWRLKSSSRPPFSTSMIQGARVTPSTL